MSSRNQRVNKGIASLVERLHVDIPGEDQESAEERQNNAIDFVTELLQRYTVLSKYYMVMLISVQLEESSSCRRRQPSLRSDQEAIDPDEF